MTAINRQWLLKQRPVGAADAQTFEYRETPLPDLPLKPGETLVKVLALSFDPAMRGWMEDVPSYLPPVPLGEPMRASGVGRVIASENPELPEGTLVQGFLGWQEYALGRAGDELPFRPLPEGTEPTMALSVFGATSYTAYFGLLEVGQAKAGDTVVVSGAAGATGSVALQIARLKGCRTIGIAGGDEKCQWLSQDCKADAVIDYRSENVGQRLAELCPEGIDVFFDNVGGDILEAAIANIAERGRIVLCGQIASYNDVEPRPGPRNLTNLVVRRARMEGFIVMDFMDQLDACLADLAEWVLGGEIVYREDIQHGFDNIPATFDRLFSGANKGKQLLLLDD